MTQLSKELELSILNSGLWALSACAPRLSTFAFINQVENWWHGLSFAPQVFYGIAFVAGFVSLLLAAMAVLGLEHHDGLDAMAAHGGDHGGGGIFSVKPLAGFFLGFGWIGGLALDNGLSFPVALLAALSAGGAMMAVIVLMFRGILAMRSDGTVRIADAVGAVGTVYVTLPPTKAAGGQVTVHFQGRQETFAALNASGRPLPSGEKIKVLAAIDGQTLLVEPLR